MDLMKFFAVGHANHVLCNPTSEAKLDELIGLLDLPAEARLLDIACGKAELMVRTARRYGCRGVGVDLSADFVSDARGRIAAADLGSQLEIIEGDGARYEGDPASFDAAVCLGASWVFGGWPGTLRALSRWAKPGGLVLAGEPFWIRTPSPEYLEAKGLTAESFATHHGNVQAGLDAGLVFLHTIVSAAEDWDRYEGLCSYATERWAQANPDDPDRDAITQLMRRFRDSYLRWGRDELGWAMYLFVKLG